MIVVYRSFTQQVGLSLLHFEAGSVIEDEVLCKKLLASNSPVTEVTNSDDLIQCPHCRRTFTVAHAVAGEVVPVAAIAYETPFDEENE